MTQRNGYTERTNAPEEELKLARERFNIIFQNTTVSIWDYIFETKQIIQPTRSQELHGFDTVVENVPESLIENGFVHPDSVQEFRRMYEKLLAGAPQAEGIFRVQTADRTGYWYEHIRYNTLFNEQGVPYAAVGMSTDETADVENRLAAKRWKELLNDTLGKEAVILEFDLTNDTFVQITGADHYLDRSRTKHGFDAFMDAYADIRVWPGDAAEVKKRLRRSELLTAYMDGKYDFSMEYRMKYGDGTYWIRLSTRLMYHETDGTIHFYMLHSDITGQKEQELALQRKAETDALTGLLNHNAFAEKVRAVWAQQPEHSYILLLLDLDNFKDVNDTYGHAEGDQALSRAAGCLETVLREEGALAIAARVGGDEFAVFFCEGIREQAELYARKLIRRLSELTVDGICLSASVGLAVAPEDGAGFDSLGVAADRALYYVKHHGKTGYCFYDDIFTSDTGWLHRRQKLLADTMEGGMVGGYMEEGFPYYFVDASLLHWLGYGSEAAFVEDIDGLITNMMHPDDRDYVDRMVEQQLASGGRYEVDYRMKKSDGSYIWVHDIGEKMTAEDGRAAITSVCYDITREKEHDKLIDQLVDDLEARVALYRVEKDIKLTLLHASENVMEVTHYSDAEYWEICREDAVDFVYIPDRELVRSAIRKAMKEDLVVTEHFRLCNKKGGFTWITGIISRLGSNQGRPVARIIFMPFSIQSDLQLQMLDTKYIGVYVIDEETEEVYFANRTVLNMYGVSDQGIAGRSCHDIFFGKETVCENCWRKAAKEGEAVFQEHAGRVLSMETQKRVWNGRRIVVVYSRDITEQYRLQKQQQALFDNIPAGISLFSVKNMEITPVFFSSMIEKAFGIDTGRILEEKDSQAFFRCVHPDDLPRLMAQLSADVKEAKNDCCYRYRCWNAQHGAYFWVELRANMVKNGDETLVYATYNDVTKANRMQEQLEENQAVLEARIEVERQKARSSRDNTLFYYIANVTENQVTEYRLPFAREPVTDVPMDLHTFVASGCRSMGNEADQQMMIERHDAGTLLAKFRSGVTFEEFDTQFTLEGGVTYWSRHKLSLLQEPFTGDVYLYEYVYDVSQEKIMDLMLRYEMSHGCEAVGFLSVETGQLVVAELGQSAGGQWQKVAIPFDTYMRRYAETCIIPEDREKFLHHYLDTGFDTEEPAPAEVVYRCIRDGKTEYLSGMLHGYEEDGKKFCVLARRNVTELIRTEEEKNRRLAEALKEAEKASRAKTDFLSRMSHDIRTPLNGVIGMTEIVLSENRDPHLRADLETIASSGQFLLSLINDILDISRIESGKLHLHPAPVPLESFDHMIDAIIRPLMREKNITFDYQMNCGLQCANLDEVRFNQIFFNLLSNAVKFTPEGGHIVFSAWSLSGDDRMEWVRFSVKDNGIGMSREFMEKAFEPFEQMHDHGYSMQQRQGTGLGLAIVRELVALMGGTVSVNSTLGEGSEFLVDLPLEKCMLPEKARTAQTLQEGHLLEGKKILLVEDNEINLLVAMRLLEGKGLKVTSASNGQEALEIYEASAVEAFDAILMDVRMPVMDGLEATRRIRALGRPDAKTVPILAMSANAYEEDRQMSFEAGMNDHLSKPVEPELLYQMLIKHMNCVRKNR